MNKVDWVRIRGMDAPREISHGDANDTDRAMEE